MSNLQTTVPPETMIKAVEDINFRLRAVKMAYDDYDPKCNRRAAWDNLREVRNNLEAFGRWLDGTNDTPIVWFREAATQEGRDTYRVHYAADALVSALHYLLVAEVHAGIITVDEAEPRDPWRYIDGKSQGEAERLHLSEGITWTFPRTVLS